MSTPEKKNEAEDTVTNMDPPKATPKSSVLPRTTGPTPQNKDRWRPGHFMSPTDAMVSPCTQKLMMKRNEQGRPQKSRSRMIQSISKPTEKSKLDVSKVANKENEKEKENAKPVTDVPATEKK